MTSTSLTRAAAAGVLSAVADPERLAAVEQTGLLDGASDPALDRLARLAGALMGTPVSFVSLVGLNHQAMPGAAVTDRDEVVRTLPMEETFCQYSVATGEPLIIEDTRRDLLVRETRVVAQGDLLSYAGIPLQTERGHVLGALCVLDRQPRDFDDVQLELLRDLAALVELELEHRLTAGRIVGVHGLGRQVADQVETLTAAVTSLVELAERQDDPRLQRYAALSRSRLKDTDRLVRDLRDTTTRATAQSEAAAAPRRPVDLRRVVESSARAVVAVTRTQHLRTRLEGVPLPVRCDAVRLERAVTQVLVTALHHSRGDGSPVEVRLDLSAAQPGDPGAAGATALLTVSAPSSRIPAGELGRLVARFSAETCEPIAAGAAVAPSAAVRVVRGALVAQSGWVRGESTQHGSTFTARWALDRDTPPAVIQLP